MVVYTRDIIGNKKSLSDVRLSVVFWCVLVRSLCSILDLHSPWFHLWCGCPTFLYPNRWPWFRDDRTSDLPITAVLPRFPYTYVHIFVAANIYTFTSNFTHLWIYSLSNAYFYMWGTAVAQWLRCCATNRKVGGSILPIALWPWGRLRP